MESSVSLAFGPPSAAGIEHIIHKLENVQIAKFVLLASVTLLVYDWLLTLDEEVSLVWPSRWGASKVLFFANRYLAFVDTFLLLYVMMLGSGPSVCVKGFQILGAFSAFGIVIAELILAMRTRAIWERRTSITILISAFMISCVGVDVYVLLRYFEGVSYLPHPPHVAMQGCLLGFKTRIVFWDFVLVMMTETLMLTLLVIKALQHFRHSRSTLMVCMYRDGIFYFAFILLASIANMCTIFTAPVELHNFLIVLQRVFHSILCSRVLLHIRGAYTNRGFIMSNDMEESRNGAGFTFRKPQRPQGFNDGDSAVALTPNPGHIRFSAIAYPYPPSSAFKERFDTIGWGNGRGYGDSNDFQTRAFDVPSSEYVVGPASSSEHTSGRRTPSSVWP